MNERLFQLAIHQDKFNSCQIMAPNYTPHNWWECDVWGVTRAGYAVEYEIKLSLADFRADKKKVVNWSYTKKKLARGTFKHDLLADGSPFGPTRFFYCVPEEIEYLIRPELPEWAGLIIARPARRTLWIREVVKAKRLHSTKVTNAALLLCGQRLANRYWPVLHDMNRIVQTEREREGIPNAAN